MEAELQALWQRNAELIRDLQEQQNIAATECIRADRQSRAQTQEFANLTAELLARRQGPQVQLDGMRLSVKVEKPENYDGDKVKDLDTWLFQVREHLELLTVPAGAYVAYAASLLRGNAAMWWREACEAHRQNPQRGKTFAGHYTTSSDQKIMAVVDATNWPRCNNTHVKVSQILCTGLERHV